MSTTIVRCISGCGNAWKNRLLKRAGLERAVARYGRYLGLPARLELRPAGA